MTDVAQPTPEVVKQIQVCAEVIGDLTRLRSELPSLKSLNDMHASFAAALFDLECAKKGDPEAKAALTEIAETLLVYWRNGQGTDLSSVHPQVAALWTGASSLLAAFDLRRIDQLLADAWAARKDVNGLKAVVECMGPPGERRVQFALCLYHLELARMGVAASRREFAKRAGLIAEAYQSNEAADELIGGDEGLRFLWTELHPYLDEFFETMELEAERRRKAAEAQTQPEAAPPKPAITPVALGSIGDRQVPSFRSLMSVVPPPKTPPPPPPPSDLTPPGAWTLPSEDVVLDDVNEPPDVDIPVDIDVLPPPPPPPPNLTPPGAWTKPDIDFEADIDIVEEALVAPPSVPRPPPPPRSATKPEIPNLDIALEEPDPDNSTIAFWKFATKSLDLLPDPRAPRAFRRLLNVDNRTERKRLTDFLDSMGDWMQVDDARAFASLIRVMLAGQLKEKSLFGSANPRRAEAFTQAFQLLAPTPRSAGHAAVWFEMDGPETLSALQRGLEVMTQFLSFCAREHKDPLDPSAQALFLSKGAS